jgi:polyferredoxin
MTRQKIRKLLLIVSLLLFPVTLFYFSPALIIEAGLEGVINGSFIVFIALFLSSIFLGRLFCAYICPGGGLQECAFLVTEKPPKQRWRNNIKYGIWLVWILAVVFCYISKGQTIKIDFFYQTEHGISVTNIFSYIIYYGIILLILLPALIGGKRAFCHYICWMAPFMTIGVKLRKLLRLPGLHISTETSKCISCKKCNKTCPMGIDVYGFVKNSMKSSGISDPECIQCGACADTCSPQALKYKFGKDR